MPANSQSSDNTDSESSLGSQASDEHQHLTVKELQQQLDRQALKLEEQALLIDGLKQSLLQQSLLQQNTKAPANFLDDSFDHDLEEDDDEALAVNENATTQQTPQFEEAQMLVEDVSAKNQQLQEKFIFSIRTATREKAALEQQIIVLNQQLAEAQRHAESTVTANRQLQEQLTIAQAAVNANATNQRQQIEELNQQLAAEREAHQQTKLELEKHKNLLSFHQEVNSEDSVLTIEKSKLETILKNYSNEWQSNKNSFIRFFKKDGSDTIVQLRKLLSQDQIALTDITAIIADKSNRMGSLRELNVGENVENKMQGTNRVLHEIAKAFSQAKYPSQPTVARTPSNS